MIPIHPLLLAALALAFGPAALAAPIDPAKDCPCELRWAGSALGMNAGESVDRIIPRPDGSFSIESQATPSALARRMGAPSIARTSLALPGRSGPVTLAHTERRQAAYSDSFSMRWTRLPDGSWSQSRADDGQEPKLARAPAEAHGALDPATFPYSALLGSPIGAPFERLWLSKGSAETVSFVWEKSEGGHYLKPDPEQRSRKGKIRDFGALVREDGLPIEIYVRNEIGSAKARLLQATSRDGRSLYRAEGL